MTEYIKRHTVISALLLAGAGLVSYRLLYGLGVVSNLSDSQPWGLIKALNILAFAALAAGSFMVAALVYVIGIRRLAPVLRPALLPGFICHTFVLAALLYDVGRPAQIWRILIDPQVTSVMLLTFACEGIYTVAMICEVVPEFSRKEKSGAVNFLDRIKGLVVIVSATAAIVYQGTLGSLYLVSPHRVMPLWWSPRLPVFFLISAVAAGLGMIIIEAYFSDRAGRRRFDSANMAELGGIAAVFAWIYLVIRLGDLFLKGGTSAAGAGGISSAWFWMEVIIGFGVPAVMLSFKSVRQNPAKLASASALVALGVVMDRLGVAVIGWKNFSGIKYFPSPMEIYVSFFFILAAFALYSYASGKLLKEKN